MALTARPRFNMRRQRILWGWLFLSPWIIGFFVFYFLPMAASLLFTFTNFNLTRPNDIQFIGLDNWARLLRDPNVGISLRNTALYAVIAVPLTVIIPVLIATMLNSKQLVGKPILRTLFYLPYMIPSIAAAYIWAGFMSPGTGWLNLGLSQIGVTGPNWLFDPNWIYAGLFMISLWGVGNAVLITIAGMQNVPTELYEAARVDGANALLTFRKITLPMISPIIFYNLVLTVIGIFRFFDVPYMLKGSSGDPGNSTLFYNILLYRVAFPQQNMGYGATLAWLLFIISMVVTIIIFLWSRRWVYYSGGSHN